MDFKMEDVYLHDRVELLVLLLVLAKTKPFEKSKVYQVIRYSFMVKQCPL